MIRSYTDVLLSNLPGRTRQPADDVDETYLSDISGRPVLPDEMHQVVFTIVQDDRTFLRLRVNEICAITSERTTGFKSQDESLSVGVFHRTKSKSRSAACLER